MSYHRADDLTCSVVIVSKRDDYGTRLCRRRGARFIEVEGEVLFSVCVRHIDRARKLLGIKRSDA